MESDILSAPFDMSFHLTHACNLRCSHCYIRAGSPSDNELSPGEMNEVLDKLIKMKIFRIQLTGGEPMLREDFFDIIKRLHQKMWVVLSTNGTLINDENIKELTRYIKEIVVSIDGATARSHDAFRGVKGSFDKAVSAVCHFNNNGNKISKITINSALTTQNIGETERTIDLANSLNANAIRFSALYPKGRALDNMQIFLDNNQKKEVISRILQKKKTLNSIDIFFDDSFSIPLKLFGYEYSEPQDNDRGDNQVRGCGVARTMFSIMPNGDIVPCEMFQENPEYVVGNALRDDISRLWIESKILNTLRNGINNPELCKSCKHQSKCTTIRCAAIIKTKSYWCTWYSSK